MSGRRWSFHRLAFGWLSANATIPLLRASEGPARGRPLPGSSAGGQEAGFLHQVVVELVVGFHPLAVLVARHEGLVECAILHELLPVVRRHHLLEEVDVEGDMLGLHAW